jgi:lipoprotein-anchoring transpeptidase ErfK/SrfK
VGDAVGAGEQVGVRGGPARRPRRRLAALASAAALVLAACGGSGGDDKGEGGDAGRPEAAATPAPALTITPVTGSKDVPPDTDVTVTAATGKPTNVVVKDAGGSRVDGEFDPDSGVWKAEHRLRVSEHYTVTASALDADGAVVEQTSDFTTIVVPEAERLYAKFVAPHSGDEVGVAHPLVVGFNHPVRDKEAVQAALEVETSEPVDGEWYWIDDQYVHYRPKEFWPADIDVSVHIGIGGLKVGDRWGGNDRDLSYEIGRRQVIKVYVKKHTLQVVNGKGRTIKSFPVSTGKPGWETRNGTKVLMEKVRDKKWTNEEIDAPEFYRLESEYALRMTNSGEFIHDAPWNTGYIGNANASHGCVGMRTKDMRWLYDHAMIGDPIIVTGSPKPYKDLINRYADWNVDWDEWSEGNADEAFL